MSSIYHRNLILKKDKLIGYVNNDDTLDAKNKNLLIETILFLVTESQFRIGKKDDGFKTKDQLKDHVSKVHINIQPIEVGNFGQFWAKDGYYNFRFNDIDTAMRMPITKTFVKFMYTMSWNRNGNSFRVRSDYTVINPQEFIKIVTEKAKSAGEM